MAHTNAPMEHQTRHTSRTATGGSRLRSALRAIDRIAIRGQLGPSVGRRHDHRPERYL